MSLTYGELFAGYDGLGMGVRSVLGGETRWYAEFDKAPSAILAHHNPDIPNLGDVTKVDWAAVEPVDVITGGSPCQDLSHAGKRAGMKAGTRSGLWASMCDAIETIRPRLVVWENVRGAFSAEATSAVEPCQICVGDGGRVTLRALGRVLGDLAELGYDARWYGLRAADVGAAHGRFRVFLFATPADTGGIGWGEGASDWAGSSAATRGGEAGRTGRHSLLGTDAAPDLTLLPTPAVNDMGAAYTPETWDAWTDRMKAEHGNGNGHGKSLNIEALRLLKTPTSQLAINGGSQHPDKRKDGGHGPTLADEVEHLLPTPGVAGGGKKVPEDAHWSGNAAYKPDGTKVQVHLDYIAEQRLLPTPVTTDAKGARNATSGRVEGSEHHGGTTLTDAISQDWREYEAAIRRQEHAFGRPAPLPTEPGNKGQPRLSPRFVEWLMALPDGWVTDVPGISRNDQLKALGKRRRATPSRRRHKGIPRGRDDGSEDSMTTASRRTNHRRRYRSSALTTTAVTVVPSAFAFSTAARQTSSGMRSERGMVATSATTLLQAVLGEDGIYLCDGQTPILDGEDVGLGDCPHVLDCADRQRLIGVSDDLAVGLCDEGISTSPRHVEDMGGHRIHGGESLRGCHLLAGHGGSSSRCVSTVCTRLYLHVNPFDRTTLERAA